MQIRIREGWPDDAAMMLALGDEAVAWLVESGRTGQWGSEPWTGNPKREAAVRDCAAGGGLRVAETDDGQPLGALVITETPPPYVAPAGERELYINWLLVSRRYRGAGVGAVLIERAREEARECGIDLIRLDCYAGDDGALIDTYKRLGFTAAGRCTDGDWPGQILEMRLSEQ
ncbi:GNAT family N-acetyltransferase [Nocardia sp. NPDC051321]|uniref:GNAT family N-acetyltransferase n=1 Tax=Nocardia sp. NPDC051321 TaxID=3364323 RepID=UPI0037A397AF